MCLTLLVGLLAGEETRPRKVILLIGDGMGVAQLTAGKILSGELQIERCRRTGLITTWSQDSLITDSAAAGTALATGHKTTNGAIAVDAQGRRLTTMLEYAEESGKATGLVAACSLTHATPASFAAHVPSRSQADEIAAQLADSGVDVLFGGGRAHFLPRSAAGSKREDDRDPLQRLRERMEVIERAEDLETLGEVEAAAGLFAATHPPGVAERRPSLSALTRAALAILDRDPDGFFLMVEGSQIDWAGHANDAAAIGAETVDFDSAVGVALDFAERDGETLVVITADHETGGFAVHGGSVAAREVTQTGFTSKGHTAAMVPLFSFGPGGLPLTGINDNTDVGKVLISYLRSPEGK